MSNSDSDEDVQLYSALKQNQKRKVFGEVHVGRQREAVPLEPASLTPSSL